MKQSTKTASFAWCHESLKDVMARINAECAKLAAAGIAVDPAHIRSSMAMSEHGTRYLGSFGYLVPRDGQVTP